MGFFTMPFNTLGAYNIAVGSRAMQENRLGDNNLAIGYNSLYENNVDYNIGIGSNALKQNQYSSQNIAIGISALYSQDFQNGSVSYDANNISIGYEAMYNTVSTTTSNGINNNAIGYRSMYLNQTGYGNTAIGHGTLYAGTTGYNNVAVGASALNDLTTGYSNTAVGTNAGPTSSYPDVSNTTALGNYAAVTADNQVRIGNASVTSIGGYEPWTDLSDINYKTNIRDEVEGLNFILKLHPVTYQLNVNKLAADLGEDIERAQDGSNRLRQVSEEEARARNEKSAIVYTGLIAQEVEAAARSIGYDFSGVDAPDNENDPYGLRYSTFVVPLIKAMQEQQEIILKLEERIKELEKLVTR
jgi:hypothetical protein